MAAQGYTIPRWRTQTRALAAHALRLARNGYLPVPAAYASRTYAWHYTKAGQAHHYACAKLGLPW